MCADVLDRFTEADAATASSTAATATRGRDASKDLSRLSTEFSCIRPNNDPQATIQRAASHKEGLSGRDRADHGCPEAPAYSDQIQRCMRKSAPARSGPAPLAVLGDALLPKLLAGETRIPEAEKAYPELDGESLMVTQTRRHMQ